MPAPGPLLALPNIGPAATRALGAVGIDTPEAFLALGAREAWRRVRAMDPETACGSLALAFAGAQRGVRWMGLPREEMRPVSAWVR
ncbi:MAG TPA: TfoX/Sxy family DNA transformation protein [Deinococcales bacterium]|nr:TfoX/Sxy family DNA transformation protein [Deinococcales bacterium]